MMYLFLALYSEQTETIFTETTNQMVFVNDSLSYELNLLCLLSEIRILEVKIWDNCVKLLT
jgi:hypothetical protein